MNYTIRRNLGANKSDFTETCGNKMAVLQYS